MGVLRPFQITVDAVVNPFPAMARVNWLAPIETADGVRPAMTGVTVNVEFADATELTPSEVITLMLLLPAVRRLPAGTVAVKV
jgi:hypothetical protein